jgi:hypothetical protein
MLNYQKPSFMKKLFSVPGQGLAILACLLLLASCESNPITLALHNPIYPTASQAVTYSLERVSAGAINAAELHETISTINSSGVLTPGTETLLQSWSSPSGDLSFVKTSGYSANQMVTYRWVVKVQEDGREREKNYRVTYAIGPYPVPNQPAPVYVQGDPDDVFDLVFIPDSDITDLNAFRDHCRQNIRNAFFDEPHTRLWRKQFNFYINPIIGTARAAGAGPHIPPTNNAQLAFAEGRCLMHRLSFQDFANGGIFSTEQENRGTVMHESGHALFRLADEYCGTTTYFAEPNSPNLWNTQAGAEAAADDYGSCKSLADVRQITSEDCSKNWWKLCVGDCQMLTSGLNHSTYDCPCRSRITTRVFELVTD